MATKPRPPVSHSHRVHLSGPVDRGDREAHGLNAPRQPARRGRRLSRRRRRAPRRVGSEPVSQERTRGRAALTRLAWLSVQPKASAEHQSERARAPVSEEPSRQRKLRQPAGLADRQAEGEGRAPQRAGPSARERGAQCPRRTDWRSDGQEWRRGRDSNPRCLRTPLFESGTINHSDTSPRGRIPKPSAETPDLAPPRGPRADSGRRRVLARRLLEPRPKPACYHGRAVLGGELAVPCTCNPLQQG